MALDFSKSCLEFALGLESHAQLIAFCTWSYGKALSWPTTRSVCSDTLCVLRLPWMWMRNQSCEPCLAPQHQRCDGCGWLTLASHVDAVSCVKCNRFAEDHYTCHRCSVWSPNGRICYVCVSERESGCIIGNHSHVEMECLNDPMTIGYQENEGRLFVGHWIGDTLKEYKCIYCV